MWQLIINGPGYFDTAYELPDGETLLGRADENDIILSGDQVSRRHARFFFEDGKLFFEDTGSRNGTRANGSFLVEPHEVADKDVFTIGENTLEVHVPSEMEVARHELDAPAPTDSSQDSGEKPFGEVLVSRGLEGNEFIENISLLQRFSVQDFEMMPFLDNFGSSTTEDVQSSEKLLKAAKAAKKNKGPDQKELILFAQVSEKLNSAKDLHDFMDEVLGLILGVSKASTGVILMQDDKGNLTPSVIRSNSGKIPEDMPISRSIVGEVTRKKVALAVMNAQDDANFGTSESVIMYGLEQVICAPLLKGDELMGVVYLNRSASSSPKSMKLPRLVDLINALAHMMVSGIEKWSSREDSHAESVQQRRMECFHSVATVKRLLEEKNFVPGRLERRDVTAMVIRLHGLADACSAIADEKASSLLSDYYDVVRRTVLRFEGTLGDFIGDSVLAVFGTPYAADDDADRALACARACRHDCSVLLHQMLPDGPTCDIKVTLSSGKVYAGPVGTPENFEYALLGDAIDVAKELQTVELSDSILATDEFLAALKERPESEDAGKFSRLVTGRKIQVHEVVDSSSETHRPISDKPAAASSEPAASGASAVAKNAIRLRDVAEEAALSADRILLQKKPVTGASAAGHAKGSEDGTVRESSRRPSSRPLRTPSALPKTHRTSGIADTPERGATGHRRPVENDSPSAGTVVATLPTVSRTPSPRRTASAPSSGNSSSSSRLPARPGRTSSLPPRHPSPSLKRPPSKR